MFFPICWKKAGMFPVLKKGDLYLRQNYRSVANFSDFSELFEIHLWSNFPVIKKIMLYKNNWHNAAFVKCWIAGAKWSLSTLIFKKPSMKKIIEIHSSI